MASGDMAINNLDRSLFPQARQLLVNQWRLRFLRKRCGSLNGYSEVKTFPWRRNHNELKVKKESAVINDHRVVSGIMKKGKPNKYLSGSGGKSVLEGMCYYRWRYKYGGV
jgi:hypothetical protein